MYTTDRIAALGAMFHKATPWLLGFAWAAIVVLAALPLIADVIDPLQPIKLPNTESVLSVAHFVFVTAFSGPQRRWAIITALGLIVAVLLTLATAFFLNWRNEQRGKLLRVLAWPTVALPLAGGIAMAFL